MNKQTLQNIAQNTSKVSYSEIEEIKHLIGTYPFYYLPHVVLAKIYFEKEHYLFENALNQAAMRVDDREWLYHYIHGDEHFNELDNDTPLGKEISESIEQLTQTITPLEPVVEEDVADSNSVKNDLKDFLKDLSISEPLQENEAETDEESIMDEPERGLDELIDVSEESPLKEEEIPLDELSIIELVPEPSITESIEEPINIEPIENKRTIEQEEIEVEETIEEISTTEDKRPDIDLRKHPIYNVESFLKEEESKVIEEDEDSEKDFFYWLNHPQPIVEEQEETVEPSEEESEFTEDHTLSIIEQFIKANPSISRPKKEFYSAENMAKRSENVDFEYVTETLANIYYEQGNIDLAIKAYEKLSLQNPLKQAYFASLIEKIKKEKR